MWNYIRGIMSFRLTQKPFEAWIGELRSIQSKLGNKNKGRFWQKKAGNQTVTLIFYDEI